MCPKKGACAVTSAPIYAIGHGYQTKLSMDAAGFGMGFSFHNNLFYIAMPCTHAVQCSVMRCRSGRKCIEMAKWVESARLGNELARLSTD